MLKRRHDIDSKTWIFSKAVAGISNTAQMQFMVIKCLSNTKRHKHRAVLGSYEFYVWNRHRLL